MLGKISLCRNTTLDIKSEYTELKDYHQTFKSRLGMISEIGKFISVSEYLNIAQMNSSGLGLGLQTRG